MAIRQPSLIVNCGYARVCIYQNSDPSRKGRNARKNIDTGQRSDKFQSQFSTTLSTYGIPDGYFEQTGKDHSSQFARDSAKILDGFRLKFPSESGLSREVEFSFQKWSKLPVSEQVQHTLSKCTRCFEVHKVYQLAFPLKPHFHPDPVLVVNHEALQQQGLKLFTSNVVTELNRVYNEASSSFRDALIQSKSLQLEHKKSSAEKRKQKRKIEKAVTEKISKFFAESATTTMLTEGESKRMYHRKRLAQSFCSPEVPPQPRRKNHIHLILVKYHGILRS